MIKGMAFKRVGGHKMPLPQHSKPGDAGLDLRSTVSEVIVPGTVVSLPTGWACAIPDGYVGLVCPRSGLAAKYGVQVVNSPGVIDSGYRGEIRVLLISEDVFTVYTGDRIAQLLVVPVVQVEGHEFETLDETERGDGGFGHTGVE